MTDILEKGSRQAIAETIIQKSLNTKTRNWSCTKSVMEEKKWLVYTKWTDMFAFLKEQQRCKHELEKRRASEIHSESYFKSCWASARKWIGNTS